LKAHGRADLELLGRKMDVKKLLMIATAVIAVSTNASAYDFGPGFGTRYGAGPPNESPIVGKGPFHVLRNGENGQPKPTSVTNVSKGTQSN
jgi:hypothetical protein